MWWDGAKISSLTGIESSHRKDNKAWSSSELRQTTNMFLKFSSSQRCPSRVDKIPLLWRWREKTAQIWLDYLDTVRSDSIDILISDHSPGLFKSEVQKVRLQLKNFPLSDGYEAVFGQIQCWDNIAILCSMSMSDLMNILSTGIYLKLANFLRLTVRGEGFHDYYASLYIFQDSSSAESFSWKRRHWMKWRKDWQWK